MPIFKYIAKNSQGRRVEGLINAYNRRAATERIAEMGLSASSIKDKTDSLELKLLSIFQPVKIKDLVVFSRQFSVMISANLALVQALRIAAEQTVNTALKMTVSEVAYEVDSGSSLSAALAKRPKIFSPFYTNVIKSGETSGRLDEVLNYLADEMEKDYDMSSKIKGAMIYPAFVLGGLFVVGILMMVVVVPKLTSILTENGGSLPLSTRVVIGISNFLINFWWLLAILIVILAIAIRLFANTPGGIRMIDYIKLKLPVFGSLFQLIYITRFTRSMNTLIVGGVTISKSLDVVSEVVGNTYYKELIEKGKRDVEEGGSLSRVFLESETVPKMVPQMIIVGEKTGKLDLVFAKITDFYSREINNILTNLVALLEPSIMVVMGVAVGVMVAAVIMPMYNLASNF
jgi:type IV pilus assembly protein PilC